MKSESDANIVNLKNGGIWAENSFQFYFKQ